MTKSKNRESFLELLEKTPNISKEVIRKNLVVDVKGTLSEKGETTYSSSKNQIDVLKIKQTKGNIPINQELLNRYANIKEIFTNEKNNYDGNIDVSNTINELESVDVANMTKTEIYHKAVEIFNNYHNTYEFINDNNKIIVSNTDIKESINKINNNSLQKKYLTEHLLIFSDLGDIIEKSNLVNQTFEKKNRENNKIWRYYLNGLNINNNNYLFEFDVISKENGKIIIGFSD